eukprot:TRINITY_DN4143_c0_g1_i1.p2 TRINITY_DN4143_c0_g1~~TRINITY_DN4143_c0_g1_i1.p2  ORF type:complete len:150 (-),score=39.32 TRINITY_DN4143_c0_g1_i1:102-551(-)
MGEVPQAIQQTKPRKDIVFLAYILIVLCVINIIVGVALIFIAIFLPNDKYVIPHILQWTFALLAFCFPWFGIVGGWKCLLPALICFDIYLVFQFVWNVLQIIGTSMSGVIAKLAVQIIFAAIEIVLAVAMFIVTTAMCVMLVNYYRMQE